MPTVLKRPRKTKAGIVFVPVDEITPNPAQPRKIFSDEGLAELSLSIKQYGVLNPLTLRMRGGKYELIAGERRLRAAKMAGLCEVPCILMDVNMEESSLIALVENLQRRNLDFIEEAEGISQLIRVFGMSQEECARRLGKSLSAVANKLRLLRLPADVLETLRAEGLTERHGRALLRLPTAMEQRAALEVIVQQHMNVAAAERYISSLLEPPPKAPEPPRRKVFVLKDVRIFLNTLAHGLDVMKQGGINAGIRREETESELVLTISIPKKKKRERPRVGKNNPAFSERDRPRQIFTDTGHLNFCPCPAPQQGKTCHGSDKLCHSKGEPDIAQPREVEKPCKRDKQNHLAQHDYKDAGTPSLYTLKVNDDHHYQPCRDKAEGYQPQSVTAELPYRIAVRKNRQQLLRNSHKNHSRDQHDHAGENGGIPQRILHPLFLARTVVEAYHRQDDLLQAHKRDEEKCLKLIVYAQDSDGVLGKGFQYKIQPYYIQRIQRLHHH